MSDERVALARAERAERHVDELYDVLCRIADTQFGTRSFGGEECDCPQPKRPKAGQGKSCHGHETDVSKLCREVGIVARPKPHETSLWNPFPSPDQPHESEDTP